MSLPTDAKQRKAVPNQHGHSRKGAWSPTYVSWHSMLQRCTNPARNVFDIYGGRGIQVCERWRTFENFLHDMGERPDGTSIGRIDPDGNYELSNCAWHSDTEQARSRRNNKLTCEKAAEIRSRYVAGETMRILGLAFGVSRPMIANVVYRRAWA